jgi:hypothetical protein
VKTVIYIFNVKSKETTMPEQITRREVIKRAAYVVPVILTFTAVPAFARGGSGSKNEGNQGDQNEGNQGDENQQ